MRKPERKRKLLHEYEREEERGGKWIALAITGMIAVTGAFLVLTFSPFPSPSPEPSPVLQKQAEAQKKASASGKLHLCANMQNIIYVRDYDAEDGDIIRINGREVILRNAWKSVSIPAGSPVQVVGVYAGKNPPITFEMTGQHTIRIGMREGQTLTIPVEYVRCGR